MASKRDLKKKVRNMVFNVLNDCDYIIVSGGKDADKADALIDEAVDFHDKIISKINNASEKKDYREINDELNKSSSTFMKKVEGLSA